MMELVVEESGRCRRSVVLGVSLKDRAERECAEVALDEGLDGNRFSAEKLRKHSGVHHVG